MGAVGLASVAEDRTMDPDLTPLDQGVLEDSTDRGGEPLAIGEVLAELLAQYQARFPEVQITVVETPAAV